MTTPPFPALEPLPPLERVRIDQIVYARLKVHMRAADPGGKPAVLLFAVDRWGREYPESAVVLPEQFLITLDEARKAVQG